MHEPLLESVPNISVGRDVERVDAIVRAVEEALVGMPARLVDVHRDSDHDRSVLTLVGRGADGLERGLRALAQACVEQLDLHEGHGVHPRVGVLDVLPVVPLEEADDAREAALALAERIGGWIGTELGVPVVRYGRDSTWAPIVGAGFTGEVRRGGPATVAERIVSGELDRIAGPAAPHSSAGVTICGARDVLVAFNVDLDRDDLELVRTIAARVREVAAGEDALPGVRALGLRLASRGVSQVSTNLERHAACGPARLLERVAHIAHARSGGAVGVSAAELVGLAPDSALAPLRYACTRHGVPLLAGAQPSLDAAVASLDG